MKHLKKFMTSKNQRFVFSIQVQSEKINEYQRHVDLRHGYPAVIG
tara:strand:+ start:2810 stop:2944 length:135 start_codon:yes stop_codon:yes gene_type:complete